MTTSNLNTIIPVIWEACEKFLEAEKPPDELDVRAAMALEDKEYELEAICKQFFQLYNIPPQSFSFTVEKDGKTAAYTVDWVDDILIGVSVYPMLLTIPAE